MSQSFAVLSSYECVESGQVYDDWKLTVFETGDAALLHARQRLEDLLQQARPEVELARSLGGTYAPYIAWVMVFRLDHAPSQGEDWFEGIRPFVEAADTNREQAVGRVLFFHGILFAERSEMPYTLREALDDLVNSLQ